MSSGRKRYKPWFSLAMGIVLVLEASFGTAPLWAHIVLAFLAGTSFMGVLVGMALNLADDAIDTARKLLDEVKRCQMS